MRSDIEAITANVYRVAHQAAVRLRYIMVGEIRDTETAENAVQAALTGHLVLSTVHTNDAPSSVTRLLDLRIPHFLVLSTVIGIVAQRLVRVNCPHCSEPYAPAPGEIESLGVSAEQLAGATLRRGSGRLHCRQTGYAGRAGGFQIMAMSERVRGVIARQGTSLEILDVAKREGMQTLREAVAEKVLAGTTTAAEMLRVADT
jgi:type II secretory ATPase GspE/PulE/Tfp pilus assembly ATPase PilB-like protein